MTDSQKNSIVEAILEEKERLGSQNKVATKCDISTATISQMLNKNWALIDDRMWLKVAAALGWKSGDGWQFVETTDSQIIYSLCDDTKRESLWTAIAHGAGGGKTGGLTSYEASRRQTGVYFLSCREWARREFLVILAQNLGIAEATKPQSVDALLMSVVSFFVQRAGQKPLLILDEADKLRSPALRTLITLFNECKQLGVVISGTDHLQKQMEADARHNRKGAQELLSRFGRSFVKLVGADEHDCKNICRANGITDPKTLSKIWKECQPVQRQRGTQFVQVIEDKRRIERAVRRELLRMENEISPELSAQAA